MEPEQEPESIEPQAGSPRQNAGGDHVEPTVQVETTTIEQSIELPLFAPAPAEKHPAGDLGGLRIIIVGWCFWLLGAWAVAWLSDTSVPRVRWMLFAGSIGLMLVWPAVRLSQPVGKGEPGRGAAQAFVDWLAMVLVYQAVIWSMHLIAGWPLRHGVWLDAAVVAWSLNTALIVGIARLWPGGAARVVGMALCLALVFGEPLAVWLSVRAEGAGWAMRVSPIQALWELSRSPKLQAIAPWDRYTLQAAVVGGAGWLALVAWSIGERILGRPQQPDRSAEARAAARP